jgi:hypothetical protein
MLTFLSSSDCFLATLSAGLEELCFAVFKNSDDGILLSIFSIAAVNGVIVYS